MKWFLKALLHYADFSGRARRREYWMFVLFNFIFSLLWTLLVTFILTLLNERNNHDVIPAIAGLSFAIMMILPGMAVVVRRLHDVGKSAWWLFISLVPIIGGIWLLVLMLTSGNDGENKYGPDPKMSEETFSEHAKLKSAGVTLIVASSAIIVKMIVLQIVYNLPFRFFRLIDFAAIIMLLFAGIFLLNKKTIDETGLKNDNKPIIMLLLATSIIFLLGLISMQFGSEYTIGPQLITSLLNLTVASFMAILLFVPQNKKLIYNMAILVIVVSGLEILWQIYFNTYILSHYHYSSDNIVMIVFSQFDIFLKIAYIVLAATFLPKEHRTLI